MLPQTNPQQQDQTKDPKAQRGITKTHCGRVTLPPSDQHTANESQTLFFIY